MATTIRLETVWAAEVAGCGVDTGWIQIHVRYDAADRVLPIVTELLETGLPDPHAPDSAAPEPLVASLQLDLATAPTERDRFAFAVNCVEIARRHGSLIMITDRADIALAAQADGVHASRSGLGVHALRRILGPGRIVGADCSSAEEAFDAAVSASYLCAGPVGRETGPTRSNIAPIGLTGIDNIAQVVDIPVLAAGGIEAGWKAALQRVGVVGIELGTEVMDHSDPAAALSDFGPDAVVVSRPEPLPHRRRAGTRR